MKERVHSEGLCECGMIILKWILRKYRRMDFDYPCFGRTLNEVLLNSLMNLKFQKILPNILISRATIGISVSTVYWMCLVLWSAVYCFSVMYIIFQRHTVFKLVPEIVQCCLPQSEVI